MMFMWGFTCYFFVAFVNQLTDAYNIGIGKSDITGPAAEIVMMGFADSNETTAGILNRLYARAFLLEDPDANNRIMFVNCDLMSVMQLVHQEVLAELATKYNGLYTEQNVVLHATHTHAGPGGTAGYFLCKVTAATTMSSTETSDEGVEEGRSVAQGIQWTLQSAVIDCTAGLPDLCSSAEVCESAQPSELDTEVLTSELAS